MGFLLVMVVWEEIIAPNGEELRIQYRFDL